MYLGFVLFCFVLFFVFCCFLGGGRKQVLQYLGKKYARYLNNEWKQNNYKLGQRNITILWTEFLKLFNLKDMFDSLLIQVPDFRKGILKIPHFNYVFDRIKCTLHCWLMHFIPSYTAKLLFHQSPTRHSDCVVTMLPAVVNSDYTCA